MIYDASVLFVCGQMVVVNILCYSLFRDIPSDNSNKYSYNPCYPFKEARCEDVAVSKS